MEDSPNPHPGVTAHTLPGSDPAGFHSCIDKTGYGKMVPSSSTTRKNGGWRKVPR